MHVLTETEKAEVLFWMHRHDDTMDQRTGTPDPMVMDQFRTWLNSKFNECDDYSDNELWTILNFLYNQCQ